MESQTFQSCGYWLSDRKGEGTGHAGNCCAGARMRDAANRAPVGSLSNDDDYGKDNGKNTIGLGPVYMEVGDHR